MLNINNPYFEQMVVHIYPSELHLNKANSCNTEAPFLDLGLPITTGIVSAKMYEKRDEFNLEIVNFPFLYGDVPRSHSNGERIYFACLQRHNQFLSAKLSKESYRYNKIRKHFLNSTTNTQS